jgi:hypothetical protein
MHGVNPVRAVRHGHERVRFEMPLDEKWLGAIVLGPLAALSNFVSFFAANRITPETFNTNYLGVGRGGLRGGHEGGNISHKIRTHDDLQEAMGSMYLSSLGDRMVACLRA